MEYTVTYPAKDQADITSAVSMETWNKEIQDAEAAGIDPAAASEYASQKISLDIAREAMAKDGLKLSEAPKVEAEEKDGQMQFVLHCSLLPEVKLGTYTGLNVKSVVEPLTSEEIEGEIQRRISAEKLWNTLPAEDAAKEGDRVIIDFSGKKDGIPFEGGTAENYPLILGSGSFIPGFEEQLLGMKAGETKDIEVKFPDDYFEKSLAGAPVVFTVTVHEVQEEIKPELTNAFMEKLGLEGIRTVEEFKEKVAATLRGIKEQEADNKAVLEILDKINQDTEIDMPESMIDTHVSQHLQQLESQLAPYQMSLEQYIQMTGQDLEGLKASIRPQAEMEIRHALILETIAEKENIFAQQEELENEYTLMSQIYGMPADQIKMMIPAQAVATQIVQKKTLDFLKEKNIEK